VKGEREKGERRKEKGEEMVSPPSHAMEGMLMPDPAYSWGG